MHSHFSPSESIADLVSRGKYDAAIAKLSTIPQGEHTVDDVFGAAYALVFKMGWPTSSRMEELRQGISLLELLNQQIGETPECALVLGFAHYQLGEFKAAAEYFNKAPGAGFDSVPGKKELISRCRKALKRPQDTESFRTRVQKTWDAFAQEEADLRKMLQESVYNPRREKRVSNRISKLVDMVLPHAAWTLDRRERPILQLDPDIMKSTALQQKYFVDHAPKEVTDHWDIRVGVTPPTGQEQKEMQQGEPFSGMDVQIASLSDNPEDDLLELVVYHPLLDPETMAPDVHDLALDTILKNLGTIPFLNAFLSVEYCGIPPEGSTMKLEQLLPALEAMGYGDRNDIPYLLHRRHAYSRDPVPLDQYDEHLWRADIVQANSMDPLLDLYYSSGTSENYTEHYFAGSGAVPGFVVFPLKGQTDSPSALMESLLKELDDTMDPEIAVALGNAEGLQFGYLDLIAWDLQPALDTVAGLLRRHSLPWAYWHTFYALDRTVQIF